MVQVPAVPPGTKIMPVVTNTFCLIRESPADNNSRQLGHALFIDEPDAECIHVCFPGIFKPYIRARFHLNHNDIKQRFIDYYNFVINERDSSCKLEGLYAAPDAAGERISRH